MLKVLCFILPANLNAEEICKFIMLLFCNSVPLFKKNQKKRFEFDCLVT